VLHWLVTTVWVWFQLVGRQVVVLWQAMQLVAATGMCVAGLPVAVLPLWQVVQLVAAVKVLWSTRAEAHELVDRWQVSHTVWPTCTAVLGLPTAGGKLPVWQVPHWLLMLTLLCRRAGVHDAKPLRWQVSQLVMAAPAIDW
jgi:hypothetical protein